jgi:hypothetical protein
MGRSLLALGTLCPREEGLLPGFPSRRMPTASWSPAKKATGQKESRFLASIPGFLIVILRVTVTQTVGFDKKGKLLVRW